tara:strand:- start:623 stop:808 length:186 start_codon:yes stop_codon:yes gene_type:complete
MAERSTTPVTVVLSDSHLNYLNISRFVKRCNGAHVRVNAWTLGGKRLILTPVFDAAQNFCL